MPFRKAQEAARRARINNTRRNRAIARAAAAAAGLLNTFSPFCLNLFLEARRAAAARVARARAAAAARRAAAERARILRLRLHTSQPIPD